MKMPIEWHENCVKNQKAYREKVKDGMDQTIRDYQRLCADIDKKEQQIKEAKRQGKDGFDADKFLKKRGK